MMRTFMTAAAIAVGLGLSAAGDAKGIRVDFGSSAGPVPEP